MLHHVEIYVSDLERSRSFWSWFLGSLGYDVYQQWDEGFSYRQGETYIVFVQTAERFLQRGYHRCATGLNHLAFHARSRSQVDKMTMEAKARGITILYEDRHPYAGGDGHYAMYCEDPDRIKVELVAPEPAGTVCHDVS